MSYLAKLRRWAKKSRVVMERRVPVMWVVAKWWWLQLRLRQKLQGNVWYGLWLMLLNQGIALSSCSLFRLSPPQVHFFHFISISHDACMHALHFLSSKLEPFPLLIYLVIYQALMLRVITYSLCQESKNFLHNQYIF